MLQRHLAFPLAAAVVAALFSLTGCSGSSSSAPVTVTATVTVTPTPIPTPTTAEPANATTIATAIKAAVPEVTKLVTITENNDPNNVIGRPNGYTSAAVLYDSRAKCSDGLGADCGATVEGWPTATDAKTRAAYIEKILKSTTILGSEYDIVRGNYVLRVAGAIKPSKEKAYSAAFAAQF
jgi:hypothetical protein